MNGSLRVKKEPVIETFLNKFYITDFFCKFCKIFRKSFLIESLGSTAT